MNNPRTPYTLTPLELVRIRDVAKRVRLLKEGNYDAITWEYAKTKVAREVAESPADYYTTLALLVYFLNEEASVTSLEVFLPTVPNLAQDLRERDTDYAIDSASCASVRAQVDAFLQRVGEPASKGAAFDYYQVLIDRVFTSTSLVDLLDTLDRLAVVLERWYPSALAEVRLIARLRPDLETFFRLAAAPISLSAASEQAGRDLTPLGDILHRFVRIGVLSRTKLGRQFHYTLETSAIDTSRLRKEWSWLWCQPGQRLSLKLYAMLANAA